MRKAKPETSRVRPRSAPSLGKRAEIAIAAGLGLLVLLALAWLAGQWAPGEVAQVGTRLAGSILALVLVAIAMRSPRRWSRRLVLWLYGLAAVAAVVTYYNFGAFYRGGLVNEHEMFHYFLGAKYFPELGYDGLYLASLNAEAEADVGVRPGQPMQRRIRDLRSNRLVETRGLGPELREVRERFSEARWSEFRADHAGFLDRNPDALVRSLRLDHGYNPTPAWTFVAQFFTSRLSATRGSLAALACLDFVLLALAFALVFRTYGSRVGFLAMIVFGLGYGWRFYYIGGAFLRLDWLAAVVAAVCAMERRHWALAGGLLGYGAAVRGFPALLMLGPGILAARALLRREPIRWALVLGAGFAVVLGLGGVAGSLAGRGPEAWLEFATNIGRHRELAPPNRVSLDNVLLNTPALVTATLADGDGEIPPWTRPRVEQTRSDRRALGIVVKAVFLGLLLGALWRAKSASQATILSLTAIFALVPVGSYYWVMLLLVPIRGGPLAVLYLLLLSTVMKGVQLAYDGETTRYAIKSLGLAAFFLFWTGQALRSRSRNALHVCACALRFRGSGGASRPPAP